MSAAPCGHWLRLQTDAFSLLSQAKHSGDVPQGHLTTYSQRHSGRGADVCGQGLEHVYTGSPWHGRVHTGADTMRPWAESTAGNTTNFCSRLWILCSDNQERWCSQSQAVAKIEALLVATSPGGAKLVPVLTPANRTDPGRASVGVPRERKAQRRNKRRPTCCWGAAHRGKAGEHEWRVKQKDSQKQVALSQRQAGGGAKWSKAGGAFRMLVTLAPPEHTHPSWTNEISQAN